MSWASCSSAALLGHCDATAIVSAGAVSGPGARPRRRVWSDIGSCPASSANGPLAWGGKPSGKLMSTSTLRRCKVEGDKGE
eukprot:scaffold68963_cov54-Phaeocystis_antarctica.AAC.1